MDRSPEATAAGQQISELGMPREQSRHGPKQKMRKWNPVQIQTRNRREPLHFRVLIRARKVAGSIESFTELYRVLQSYTEFYRVYWESIESYTESIESFTELYRVYWESIESSCKHIYK